MQLENAFSSQWWGAKHKHWKEFLVTLCSIFCHTFASVFSALSISRCCSNKRVSSGLPHTDSRKQQSGSTWWRAGHLVRMCSGPPGRFWGIDLGNRPFHYKSTEGMAGTRLCWLKTRQGSPNSTGGNKRLPGTCVFSNQRRLPGGGGFFL